MNGYSIIGIVGIATTVNQLLYGGSLSNQIVDAIFFVASIGLLLLDNKTKGELNPSVSEGDVSTIL